MHDGFHAACVEVGLPHPGSLKVLLQIDEDDAPSMRDMADVLHCDASYVTGLVDALEELGYVERRVSPTDRRIKEVHVTDRGRKARERAIEVMSEPPAGLAELNAADTRTLARLAERLTEAYPTLR